MKISRLSALLVACLGLTSISPVMAEEGVLTLYSARQYPGDAQVYQRFTEQTGIRIERVGGSDNEVLGRLRDEGKDSPADVVMLGDAVRLHRAQAAGFFQPLQSDVLNTRIPARLRSEDAGSGAQWFGFSARARVIVYNKVKVKRADVATYEALADPKLKGKVCSAAAGQPYLLSSVGTMLEHLGQEATEQWAQGMVANFARAPGEGDTAQIKDVASGACGVAIVNSYYYARLLASTKTEDREAMNRVGLVWPNQQGSGAVLSISGGGVARHAPHRQAAIQFLEYLAGDEAQQQFAAANNEYPVTPGLTTNVGVLKSMGQFKEDQTPVAVAAKHQNVADQILDAAGYK